MFRPAHYPARQSTAHTKIELFVFSDFCIESASQAEHRNANNCVVTVVGTMEDKANCNYQRREIMSTEES